MHKKLAVDWLRGITVGVLMVASVITLVLVIGNPLEKVGSNCGMVPLMSLM